MLKLDYYWRRIRESAICWEAVSALMLPVLWLPFIVFVQIEAVDLNCFGSFSGVEMRWIFLPLFIGGLMLAILMALHAWYRIATSNGRLIGQDAELYAIVCCLGWIGLIYVFLHLAPWP